MKDEEFQKLCNELTGELLNLIGNFLNKHEITEGGNVALNAVANVLSMILCKSTNPFSVLGEVFSLVCDKMEMLIKNNENSKNEEGR